MTLDKFFSTFPTTTITGLVLGGIYALVALGYTLVYGVLRLINFANSEVFMLATFGSFLAADALGIPRLINGANPYKSGMALVGTLALCLLLSLVIGALTAMFVERVAYRPLRQRNAPRLVFLISAIGASFAIAEYVGEWGFPSTALIIGAAAGGLVAWLLWHFLFAKQIVRQTQLKWVFQLSTLVLAAATALIVRAALLDADLPGVVNRKRDEYGLVKFFEKKRVFSIFGANVRNDYLLVIVAAMVFAIALILFVDKTRVGRGIRAVAQDAETAKLMGVNVDRVILITFAVGGLMAGGAAFLYEIYNGTARYSVGFLIGVKAFTAAVLGGIGNVRGALLGGLLLGLIENWGASMFGANQNIGTLFSFVTLVVVLMFRPSGLLGESLGRSKA